MEENGKISSVSDFNFHLDNILEELGNFGKYQGLNYILMGLPILFNAFSTTGYIFTATEPKHRCLIPECDFGNTSFEPTWISKAIPELDNGFDGCMRFSSNESASWDFIQNTEDNICPRSLFDRTRSENCEGWIYENQNTITSEFDLGCESWKSTLVGTVNNVGQFVGMPLAGFLSDKFGRRTIMVGGLATGGVIGLIKSFSPAYWYFIGLEFLETLFISGTYGATFILAVELISPKQRVFGSTLLACFYAFGEICIGTIGLFHPYWRTLLRIVYTPMILLISYFWLIPESLRWLINNGKSRDAGKVLLRAAHVNKITLSTKSLDILNSIPDVSETDVKNKSSMKEAFTSSILMTRLFFCSLWWITCTFTYYGLSLNSVSLAGNLYLNFILVSAVELPGYIMYYLSIDRFGRKYCLSFSFLGGAIACISFAFIPSELHWIKIAFYMFGKFCITIAFTVVYVYTTELFPTQLRHSLMATCSMFGRLGSIIAPQTPLLNVYFESLPLILFGGTSLISGITVLFFPETLNTKLPDTIEEAENLSRNKNKL